MVCREILQQGWHFPLGNTRLSIFSYFNMYPKEHRANLTPVFVLVSIVLISLVIAGLIMRKIKTPMQLYLNSPVLNTVTVRGDSPSAPVPMAVDLQLHKDGSVTWKKP